MFKPVRITGLGVVTPFGRGLGQFQSTVFSDYGNKAITILRVDDEVLDDAIPDARMRKLLGRGARCGLVAAQDALKSIDIAQFNGERLGVFASGHFCAEDTPAIMEVLREISAAGKTWQRDFGKVAIRRLPSFMLLRRLPNSAFCQAAQLILAKGYNATVMSGALSAFHAMRHAAIAISNSRIDAALVVCFDSMAMLTDEYGGALLRMANGTKPIALGESGVAFFFGMRRFWCCWKPGFRRVSFRKLYAGKKWNVLTR